MASLEIVGLVLGAFPLAIKAIQTYREALYSIRNVKRDLDRMERDIQTEQLRFQNTCETLLIDIVPPLEICAMIKDPSWSNWKLYAEQLEDCIVLRVQEIYSSVTGMCLYTSYDRFNECIEEISSAMHELRLQLGVEKGSKIILQDRPSIIQAAKRSASFIWKKKEYENIILRIKDSNKFLEDLARVSSHLKPGRRRRLQHKFTALLRSLSHSIYDALCDALICPPSCSHSIGLQLSHRDIILSADMEERAALELDFCVAIRLLRSAYGSCNDNTSQHSILQLPSHWKNFQLQPIENIATPDVEVLSQSPAAPSVPSPRKRLKLASPLKSKLRAEPSLSSPSVSFEASSPKTSNMAMKDLHTQLPRVTNLCNIARTDEKSKAIYYYGYGYVTDNKRKFALDPYKPGAGLRQQVSLGDVIHNKISQSPIFGLQEKLQVALTLSTSILQLHGTPWAQEVLTLDDIVFMVEDEIVAAQSGLKFYRPVVIKPVGNNSGPTSSLCPASPTTTLSTQKAAPERRIQLPILSLGMLLVQIAIGRVDDELNVTDSLDFASTVSKIAKGRKLKEEIQVRGSLNYADAVMWCLERAYDVVGLQNMEFCEKFHEAVVSPLERDLKAISTGI